MSITRARREIMKKGIWKNQEVKDLFSTVENYKNDNKALKEAFVCHAKKYGRKPNSVRNYYYHEIDNLASDSPRLKKLGIDLEKHQKSEIAYFSEAEEKALMERIDRMVKDGVSVRKACLALSNGDVSKMLRYQNKYRNFLAKQKPKYENKDNIIKFASKKSGITDGELQALFMGLVRLVKRNAQEEYDSKLTAQLDKANASLRKALVEMSGKEKELKDLKNNFLKIKEENLALKQELISLRCDKANKLKDKLTSVKSKKVASK